MDNREGKVLDLYWCSEMGRRFDFSLLGKEAIIKAKVKPGSTISGEG